MLQIVKSPDCKFYHECTVSEVQYRTPSKEHYGNEVHLTGQNPPSKCWQPLEFGCTFLKGLDLSIQ